MNFSNVNTKQDIKDINWDEALNLYENVIKSGNEHLIVKATIKFAFLAHRAPEDILLKSVSTLVELFRRHFFDTNRSICETIIICLKRIACIGNGKLAEIIGQSETISLLLRILQDPNGHQPKLILKCLRNIVKFSDSNCKILVRSGGLEIIFNMLNDPPDEKRLILLEILSSLALLLEARRKIVSLKGLCFLVESVNFGKISSRTRAAQAIGSLGLNKKLRCLLIDSGSIEVLVELFRHGDIQAKIIAANAIGVITSHVDFLRIIARAGAIPLFVDLIKGPHPLGREIAEDVLCVISVVEENAIVILNHLLRILKTGDDEAKCTVADVLWNLSGYKHALLIRNSGFIPVLVGLLRHENVEVREKVLGAVSQLSYNGDDRIALANEGAIEVILEMLRDESEEVRENAAESIVNFSGDCLFGERVAEAFNLPAFRNILERMNRIRNFQKKNESDT